MHFMNIINIKCVVDYWEKYKPKCSLIFKCCRYLEIETSSDNLDGFFVKNMMIYWVQFSGIKCEMDEERSGDI